MTVTIQFSRCLIVILPEADSFTLVSRNGQSCSMTIDQAYEQLVKQQKERLSKK